MEVSRPNRNVSSDETIWNIRTAVTSQSLFFHNLCSTFIADSRMMDRVIIFALTTSVAYALTSTILTTPSVFAEWSVLNYTWDATHTHSNYIETNQYIPQNCALAGIAVDKEGSVYVTVPRWRTGVPATLNKLEKDPITNLYTLTPYPSWDIQKVGDNSSIQSCQAAYIDSNNFMWVVDTGRRNILSPSAAAYVDGQPTLWLIDIATGANTYTYRFPADVASPSDSFLNDIVLDEVNNVAYFSDAWGAGALITLDVTNGVSRRYSGLSTGNQPSYVMIIDNTNYGSNIFTTPSDGIALTEDNQALLYCAVQGDTLYRLPTSVLRNFSTTSAEIDAAVETLGFKNPSDGMKYQQGILYYGDLPNSTFHALNVTATSRPNIAAEARSVPSDPNNLRWVRFFYVLITSFAKLPLSLLNVLACYVSFRIGGLFFR